MYPSKEKNMKIQYANEFVENLGMGDPTTCFISSFTMKSKVLAQIKYNILLCVDLYYATR